MAILQKDVDIKNLSRSITSMVKQFLSKELAAKITAARKSRTNTESVKFIDMELWHCMKGIFTF